MRLRLGISAVLVCSFALTALGVAGPATADDQPGAPSAEVQQILEDDETANLDENGFLYYVDPAPEPPAGYVPPPQRSQGFTTSQAGLPIPALNSRASTHTIFLDFDGIALPGTSAWSNAQSPGDPVITAGSYTGFTLDGSADFSQAEIDFITKTWRIVAEKYSPFDVNVTTVDPGQAALTRTNSGDDVYGVQVVVTNDTSPVNQICGGSCAGIAYNDLFDGRQGSSGVFNTVNYTVAWVFSSKTFGSAQMTAHDASHEIGHTLGLGHDGGSANPNYYAGHANWIPIMGLTNQQAVAQFSKGEYTGANNGQDDLAVIGTNGSTGLANSFLVEDDFKTSGVDPIGDPIGNAVLGDATSYTVDGVISGASDDDVFSISRTCTDPLTVQATGIKAGQSLDIKVDILDATGASVLDTENPASGQIVGTQPDGDIAYAPTGLDALGASLPSTTAGTTYRVRVDGSGNASPFNTGYSDYGSIGQYHLTISGCPPTGATAPGPPASASASPNARTTTGTVSWTAPTSNGGSPITGYDVVGLPGGTKNLGNVLSYNATNLVPGTTYNVAVFAKNAAGTSASSANTTLKVDTWAPTAKPGLTAALTGSTATLTWTAPANTGGAVLTGWHVVGTGASPVDETLAAGTLSKGYTVDYGTTTYTVTGTYTATDTAGIVSSDPKSVNRLTTAPSAPASASTVPAVKGFTGTVNWTAPASNGGSAVTDYRITGLPEGTVDLGNVLTYNASGLVPGTTYNLAISAKNANGYGPTRAATLRVATWAPTEKPTLTVTRSGTTATLTYAAPANPGKATLTGWFIDRTGPGTSAADKTVTTTSTTMAGLVAGTHSFKVRPVWSADDTTGVVFSDGKSVVVTTKPSAPKIGTASSGAAGGARNATARWVAPTSAGGTAITSYKVVAYKIVGGKVARTYTSSARPAAARSYVWALPAGSYKFRVVAYNKVGASPASAYSKVVVSR